MQVNRVETKRFTLVNSPQAKSAFLDALNKKMKTKSHEQSGILNLNYIIGKYTTSSNFDNNDIMEIDRGEDNSSRRNSVNEVAFNIKDDENDFSTINQFDVDRKRKSGFRPKDKDNGKGY